MIKILDRDGIVIKTSENLRGLRDYINNSGDFPRFIDISEVGNKEGLLSILFQSGASSQVHFLSFEVLKGTIKNWRGLYGYPFMINGESVGIIEFKSALLK